jgi:hypothetical protein
MDKKFFVPLIICIITFAIYYITGEGSTPYNYYVYLADAFLHGRLYLTENPSWLSELIPINGKYYVIYPPMPALLILPFVAFRGLAFDQTIGSVLIGSINSAILYIIVKKIFRRYFINTSENGKLDKKIEIFAIWIMILFSFGTIYWFLASVGSSWYLAQVTGVLFIFLALNEFFGKSRPFIIGIFLGAAYWSRLPVILSITFFIIAFSDKFKFYNGKLDIRKYSLGILTFFLGVVIFVGFDFIYNYLRFNTIFDIAYYLQPGILSEPWFSKGYFNLIYIPNHLNILFLKGPILINKFPYMEPSWAGMAIWMTTPAFIFSLKAPLDKITLACWSSIILISIIIMSHGGTGFTQFGYRYAMDFYPFLLLLTIRGIGGEIKLFHKLIIILGVIVNLWGVVWINKFNLVGW